MPRYSQKSLDQLSTCDERLQRVFMEVIKWVDCTILEGHRGEEAQNEAVRKGTSQVPWPEGNHNSKPSDAVDVVPCPIDWMDWNRFYMFAGFVLWIAEGMGVKLRSGLDWDQDRDLSDQSFNDAPHFEIVE